MDDIKLIEGGIAADDRGEVAFVNDIDFGRVRRFYLIANHRPGYIRAWHGHRHEAKFVTVVQGSALVAVVRIDDWESPSKDATVHRHALSSRDPAVLYIPAGHANGSMTLTPDAKIAYFSTSTLSESQHDDVRYDSRYWDPWHIEER